MEGTHLELRKWFVAIWLMSSQKAGISACSLQRQIGCSYKTAGRVLARIRCAMARSECFNVLSADCIEADDFYIGARAGARGEGARSSSRCLPPSTGPLPGGIVRHPVRAGLLGRLMAPVRARPPLPCIEDKGGCLERHSCRALLVPRPRAEGIRQLGRRCLASHGPQGHLQLQGIRGGSLPRPLQEAPAVICGLLQLEIQPQELLRCLHGAPPRDVPHAFPLSGIAATATVQPKLPASLPKPFAVQGA